MNCLRKMMKLKGDDNTQVDNTYSQAIIDMAKHIPPDIEDKLRNMVLMNEGPYYIKGKRCLEFRDADGGVIFVMIDD